MCMYGKRYVYDYMNIYVYNICVYICSLDGEEDTRSSYILYTRHIYMIYMYIIYIHIYISCI